MSSSLSKINVDIIYHNFHHKSIKKKYNLYIQNNLIKIRINVDGK